MSVVIYTYSNPYKINYEPYWAMVKKSFQLCVSQTLINGLCDHYKKDLYKGKLSTIKNFVNNLFADWESDSLAICQRAAIDNLISYLDFNEIVPNLNVEDVIVSLKRNRTYVLDSLRIMFELNMNPSNIKKDMLTDEQKCVIAIFEELIRTKNPYFMLKTDFTEQEIDAAIEKTMEESLRGPYEKSDLEKINRNVVVVHGIHQYSPIMLRTIEVLSKYKNVIILFNYQQDYKNVYQTWLNVYSCFESKIIFSAQNLNNDNQDYEGGRIADNLVAMIGGNTSAIDFNQKIEVLEFDNQTEFAGYVADKYEQAKRIKAEDPQDNVNRPVLYYMQEQLYAANSSVNDILKIYFPEQFGERNFLDYPIGHFCIAITNMWDPATKEMNIRDLGPIRECLSCGIIAEDAPGELVSIFDKCLLYFANETTIKGILRRLKKLKRRIASLDDEDTDQLPQLEYYDLLTDEIDHLSQALSSLNEIAETFFEDFNDENNEFGTFYRKISDVLVKQVLSKDDLDLDFKDIVVRVLTRLNEIKDVKANASFDCLRETMSLYLQQTPQEGKGANWIVRNFEQIDGDVLRANQFGQHKIYHFACLSDQDLSITHRDEFPWPLNVNFFEVAQAPVDWKYQVYVTSRLEYKNFRRYALIYGLEFSKCDIKLSYIKNENGQEKDLYYLLKVLNAQKVTPDLFDQKNFKPACGNIDFPDAEMKQFTKFDLMKFKLCKYRFLLETLVEEKTIYKDEFLLKQYFGIILEHQTRKHFAGKKYIKNFVYSYLVETIEELESDFPFVNQLDTTDLVNQTAKFIEKQIIHNGSFDSLKRKDQEYMLLRENFLGVPFSKKMNPELSEIFSKATQEEINLVLNEKSLSEQNLYAKRNIFCDKCANKDLCLQMYKVKK